jgi:hypothetical protein
MKTPVEIFDQWILSTVGTADELQPRFHPIPADINEPFESQRGRFRNRISQIRSAFLPGRDIEIYADFLDDGESNAVADIYGCMGLIGVNKGSVMLPVEMFNRMLSHPLVLPHLGNSRVEKVGPQHREGMPTNYNTLVADRTTTGRKSGPTFPIDPTRQAVVLMCSEIAWGFLALHELIHIVHGHVEYLYKTRGVPYILEGLQSGKTPALSQDDLDFQTLELWADSIANSAVLRGLLTKSPNPILNAIFPKPEQKLALWSFAMHTLFRIWGLKIDPADLQGHSHPPTLMRFEMSIANAKLDVTDLFPELESSFGDVIKAGQFEAEKGIQYSGAKPIAPADIQGTFDPAVTDHLNSLVEHFENVLTPELKKYSYVEIKTAK